MYKKLNIIAEIGINHNGSYSIAKKLVDEAQSAGADYVKFQNFIPEELVTTNLPRAKYQLSKIKKNTSMLEMLKKYNFDLKKTQKIIKYCKKKKIKFLSSPFDNVSLNFLIKKKIKLIKIASGEITNFLMLKLIANYNLKIIMSTGMSNIKEVSDAVKFLIKNGFKKNNIILLHCTSEYPAKPRNVNLNAMLSLKKKFRLPYGYSDHTNGYEASICAVCMGATVIEKHLTLDKKLEGPDHKASLTPKEFSQFVKILRNVKIIKGSFIKKPTSDEKKMIKSARKYIVAKKNIKKNDNFTYENITVKRSGKGISAKNFFKILNKKAKKSYYKDEVI
jgi:N,N'-diacetyllegionaminate synthase